jgi:hypothetical protein
LTGPYIFLCEGDHDQECIEEILKSLSIKYLQFSHDKILKTRGGEQKIIRDFLFDFHSRRYSRHLKAIIKNEKNKDNCIHQFLQILRSIPSSVEICVLLDSDNKKTLRELRKKLRDDLGMNLDTISTFCYCLSEAQKIFIIPKNLEIEIERSIGKKIDLCRDRSKRLAIVRDYLSTNPEWVQEFKTCYR